MSEALDRLVRVVEDLRDHCPWTAALTHADLTEYLVEEAYEALEQIEALDAGAWVDTAARRADGSYAALAGELGDVLFQVVLHAAVSRAPGAPRETAGFTVEQAADALTAKMIRRNPLVFTPEGVLRSAGELAAVTPEAVERAWEDVKRAERSAAGGTSLTGSDPATGGEAPDVVDTEPAADFGGIPAHLPALAAAAAIVDRAGRRPVDPLAAHAPLTEADARGIASAAAPTADAPGEWADEEALGRELFALVRRARAAGLDPERALRGTVARVRAGEFTVLGG